jgi:hypothetical protein
MIDLSMVTTAIVAMGVEAAWEKTKRREAVIKLLQGDHLPFCYSTGTLRSVYYSR